MIKKLILVSLLLAACSPNSEVSDVKETQSETTAAADSSNSNPMEIVITDENAESVWKQAMDSASMDPSSFHMLTAAVASEMVGVPEDEQTPWEGLPRGKTLNQIAEEQSAAFDKADSQQSQNTSLKIGAHEITMDNGVAIQVLSVKKVGIIDEKNNQFMISKAQPGNKIYVFDYLVKNGTAQPLSINPMFYQPTMTDDEGYQYSAGHELSTNLAKGPKPTPILPNGKARFQIAIEAPENAKNLKLMPGMIDGMTFYAYQVQ